MRSFLIGLVLLSGAVSAFADSGMVEAERRHQLLAAHQGRLETLLGEQSKRVARLKSQSPGVARDVQLQGALRDSQATALRLTRLRDELRRARRDLLAAYDRALNQASGSARAQLVHKRARLAESDRPRGNSRIVTEGASPNDGPDDLDEKADLLKDSEEKVRRQQRMLLAQLQRLQQRARLQRHGRAADDNPFVEDAPRRAARTTVSGGTPGALAAKGATGTTRTGTDAVKPPSATPKTEQDSFTNSPGAKTGATVAGAGDPSLASGSVTSGGSVNVSVRDVIDPAILRDLQRATTSGDVKARIAALQRASAKLGDVAGTLAARAKALRERARQLRKAK